MRLSHALVVRRSPAQLALAGYAVFFAIFFSPVVTRGRIDSALVAGFVFGVSGFMCAHLADATIIHAAMWLPALLLSIAKLSEQRSAGWTIATAAAVACCVTAGHLQIAAYSLSLAAVGLGLAATAVQLLPTLELAGESTRHSLAFSDFVTYSLRPHLLITLVFPYILGSIVGDFYQGPYFGPGGIEETVGYVGTSALVLAACAVASSPRQTIIRFWSAAGVLALLLSFGDTTPLGSLVYRIPIFQLFRAQARFLVIVDFSLAVLAGLGVDAVLREHGSRRWLRLATFAGPAMLRAPVRGGARTAARGDRGRACVLRVLPGVAVRVAAVHMPSEMSDLRERLRAEGGRWLPVSGIFGPPSALVPDISSLWGVPSASKYGPLTPQRYSELFAMHDFGAVERPWGAYDDRALDLAGVRYAAMPSPRYYEEAPRHPSSKRTRKMSRTVAAGGSFERSPTSKSSRICVRFPERGWHAGRRCSRRRRSSRRSRRRGCLTARSTIHGQSRSSRSR